MWAKASISPLFELAGEVQPVGKADCVHISTGIVLRTHAVACDSHGSDVGAPRVENDPSLDAGLSRGDVAIGMQVNLPVAARHIGRRPGLVDEDQMVGIERRMKARRASATSGRSRSAACRLFFARDLLRLEKLPQARQSDADPMPGRQGTADFLQGQAGCLATNSNTAARCLTKRER
jgi:hypothetical protein